MSPQSISTRTSFSSFISNNDGIPQRNNSKSLFSSSTYLKIKLMEPALFLRGNPQESLGCFLRGELILILDKPTKIKKLDLKFNGKSKTFWPEGRIYYGSTNNNDLCEECELISKNWTFLSYQSSVHPSSPSSSPPPLQQGQQLNSRLNIIRKLSSKSYTILQPNIYTFPFELFIPGDSSETIDTELASVSYKLSATLFRPGLLQNIHVTKQVPIMRASISEEINSEGIVTSSDWKNLFGYEIMIPKKVYPIGQPIEMHLKLIPKVKHLDFVELKIQLTETCIRRSKGHTNQDSKVLKTLKIENLDKVINDNKFIYHKNISFILPKPSRKIHSSCETTPISIIHNLKFIYTIKVPSNFNIDGGDDSNNNNNITINVDDNDDDDDDDNNKQFFLTRSLPIGEKVKKKKISTKIDIPITLSSFKAYDDLPQYDKINYDHDNINNNNDNDENNNDFAPDYLPTFQTSPPNYENSNNFEGNFIINNNDDDDDDNDDNDDGDDGDGGDDGDDDGDGDGDGDGNSNNGILHV